ncbi:MAG: 2-amino-4-hydroxy-6-hydroxymethyldihydropteridine diphosphokinase [Bacteroidota bacterium]
MILLGIGSNLGNRENNLREAIDAFPAKGIKVLRCSHWYESPAWGITDQPGFLNGVLEVAFDGTPEELLTHLLAIEEEMGRVRTLKWGPRLIDLDILECNRVQMQTERLTLPHPFYQERAFVLVPLAELEPDWVPTAGEFPISALIEALGNHQVSVYAPSDPHSSTS